MGFFIDNQGNYYEGDKADMGHKSVPQRPSPEYRWDGEWVIDQSIIDARQAEQDAKDLADLKAQAIDHVLEWISQQDTAPETLKELTLQTTTIKNRLSSLSVIDGR